MNIPEGTTVYEGELATFWLDEQGILCANSKSTVRTLERQTKSYELVSEIIGGKKVCLLSDVTFTSPQDKETRDYSYEQLPKYFKAMAVISDSVLGEYVATIYVTLKNEPIPIKICRSEMEAKEWLQQFL